MASKRSTRQPKTTPARRRLASDQQQPRKARRRRYLSDGPLDDEDDDLPPHSDPDDYITGPEGDTEPPPTARPIVPSGAPVGRQLPLPWWERVAQAEAEGGFPDHLARIVAEFIRTFMHLRDELAGVLVLLIGLYGLLGVFGWSEGSVVMRLGDWFRSGLGVWGAAITASGLVLLGIAFIIRRLLPSFRLPWVQIAAGEVALVAGLTTWHLWLGVMQAWRNGSTVAFELADGGLAERAMAGEGGGLVGWSLGLLLADNLGGFAILLTLLLTAVMVFFALGLTLRRVMYGLHRVQVWLGAEARPMYSPRPATPVMVHAPHDVVDDDDGDFDDEFVDEDDLVATPIVDSSIAGSAVADVAHKPGPAPEPAAAAAPASVPKEPVAVGTDDDDKKLARKVIDREMPPVDLLNQGKLFKPSQREIDRNSAIIEDTLDAFGIPATVVDYQTGPTITQYAVEPGYLEKGRGNSMRPQKVRVSQIEALKDDISLALELSPIRIEAPVPGKSYVGIEVPNRKKSLVSLKSVMESEAFLKLRKKSPLALALGQDVSGQPVVADLGRMPHVLIAGTTGSGKSVCIVSLITCLVMTNAPDELQLVLIDPKKVELVRFADLPHVLGRPESELERIITTLRWVVREMDRRYKVLAEYGARDIATYNRFVVERGDGQPMPRIGVFIDELADLMMMAPEETERTLVRLAQMARATGIHLVVATQRPSVDIVTGLIKANFPARISFNVASSTDSRVILDEVGADTLLGKGDMLYLAPEVGTPRRLQGAYVSDREQQRVVKWWASRVVPELETRPQPVPDEVATVGEGEAAAAASPPPAARPEEAPWDPMLRKAEVMKGKDDDLERAIAVVQQFGEASASLLQRKLRVGYPRAARLMDELQSLGIIGSAVQGGQTREVLMRDSDDPLADIADSEFPP